ncbi:MAG: ornithine carbamoyltransferase [Coriobacteriales bacterium]|jgi:ornithine carbamoyltransferase|nr:ornithine carbamoyltransferase [Coriobacteriales bacterium]
MTINWAALDAPYPTLAKNPLAGRDLLRLSDLTAEQLHALLSCALAQKRAWKSGDLTAPYAGKSVAIIMEKPSLRTRVSFELGAKRLGAQTTVMGDATSAFSRGESIKDTVMVLERYVDAIVLRTYAQSRLEEVAQHASVPVVNALSDDFHPCQGLADLLTIYEHKGDLSKQRIAYIGDGNNMAHTYLEAAALTGCDLTIAAPPGYQPRPDYLRQAQERAAMSGAKLKVVEEVGSALAGADVVITDTWASMGAEAEHDERARTFAAYQVDAAGIAEAAPGAIFLHCLPAHRGEEVSDEVMDAPYSKIYDEAENRLHVQKALLSLLLADPCLPETGERR